MSTEGGAFVDAEEKCNRLSTERVPGVDARCQEVTFVHKMGIFCGWSEVRWGAGRGLCRRRSRSRRRSRRCSRSRRRSRHRSRNCRRSRRCCCGGIYSTRICSIWEVVVVTFTLPAIWSPGMQMIFPVASHRTITLPLCRCSNFMSER